MEIDTNNYSGVPRPIQGVNFLWMTKILRTIIT